MQLAPWEQLLVVRSCLVPVGLVGGIADIKDVFLVFSFFYLLKIV